MGARITLIEVSEADKQAIRHLARSRTATARTVERAQVIQAVLEGKLVEEVAVELRLARNTVYLWLGRFRQQGIAGLEDHPRQGRPARYGREQVGEMVAAALTPPQKLGLPFASWTLDRLVAYLHEHKGIAVQRSRLNEILLTEGLRWRKEETWFGERVDPDFAQKRGP